MILDILPYSFSICQISKLHEAALPGSFCFLAQTDQEISLVCPTDHVPHDVLKQEDGFQAFRIKGTLDFSLVGILSRIASLLAKNQISLFAVSTFRTDYIFIKKEAFQRSLEVLKEDGFETAVY